MPPVKTSCLAAALALGAFAVAGCREPARPLPAVGPRPGAGPAAADISAVVGSWSCSGRGCHGDLDRSEKGAHWPSSCSYSLFIDHDPHANAYRSLTGTKGQKIGKLLGTAPQTDPRCLACHVTPQTAHRPADGRPLEEWSFGVGCEACHGPARKWLSEHAQPSWRALSASQKARKGMNDLGSPAARARVCAGCHVGAPEEMSLPLRDMNHDHIAAGHPRLMFEFSAYTANQPRHWRARDHDPADQARAWMVGQVVAAEAAVRLLADRANANRADQSPRHRPWPEFSQYDCYSCHHDLAGNSWRQARGYRPGAVGLPLPGRWYTGIIRTIEEVVAPPASFTPAGLDAALRRARPLPTQVKEQAEATLGELQRLTGKLEDIPLDGATVTGMRQALARRGADQMTSDWDETEQLVLGLVALVRAEGARELEQKLKPLLQKLAFPRDHNSPRGFRQAEGRNDGKASPSEELKRLFQALQ